MSGVGTSPEKRLFRVGETVIIGFPFVNCEARIVGHHRGRVTVSMPDGIEGEETQFSLQELELLETMRDARSGVFTDRLPSSSGTLVDVATIESRLALSPGDASLR